MSIELLGPRIVVFSGPRKMETFVYYNYIYMTKFIPDNLHHTQNDCLVSLKYRYRATFRAAKSLYS